MVTPKQGEFDFPSSFRRKHLGGRRKDDIEVRRALMELDMALIRNRVMLGIAVASFLVSAFIQLYPLF